jgi:hypothetical protein
MSLPSGLIFFLDFTFVTGLGDDKNRATDRFGNEIG